MKDDKIQEESIAPAILKIFKIKDGERLVGVELTNGRETWFYSFNQDKWSSLRLGKFPRKSALEVFERALLFQFPEDTYDLMIFCQQLAEHIQKSNQALDKIHIANLIYEYFQIGRPILERNNDSFKSNQPPE